MAKKSLKKRAERFEPAVKIGLLSRVDYGSKGFRQGLINLAVNDLENEDVSFVIVAGGLVAGRALERELKEKLRGVRKDRDKGRSDFIREKVDYLAANLPRVKSPDPKKQWLKIYVVTSPSYDGDIGYAITRELARRRPDIHHWGHGEGIFPTKKKGRDIAVLTPSKAAWLRGKYHSTPVERVILDWTSKNHSAEPHTLVIGCFGSKIEKPGKGESKLPFVSLPALCRLWETTTGSENQVGATVLEYTAEDLMLVRTYSYNDVIANETDFICHPEKANRQQVKIVNAFKKRGPMTIGLLQDATGIRNRRKLQKELENLQNRKPSACWPGIDYDDTSHLYSFNRHWLQRRLKFLKPKGEPKEDSLLAFGCLHAGSVHTNYKFFVEEVPKIIVDRRLNLLVGAGDFVEGTKHNLILRQEVFGGAHNTDQEELSATYVGEVILRVFKMRMDESLKGRARVSPDKIEELINQSLINFVYIPGNHCSWSKDDGYSPLALFRHEIIRHVVMGIREFLKERKLQFSGINGLVAGRIIKDSKYKFPSGLGVEIFHPYMSRTITTSIRPQQTLAFSEEPVVVSANFHVAEAVGEWQIGIGQRCCLQVGTIKDRSDFEDNKLKVVDSGVGYLRVVSVGGRIRMTETIFYNAKLLTKHKTLESGKIIKGTLYKLHGVKVYNGDKEE